MPHSEICLPVGAYNITPNLAGQFTRTGKDGAEVVVPVFRGSTFFGEVLEGDFQKYNDGSIVTPKALVTGGELQLTGTSSGAGVTRWQNLVSKSQLPLLNDLVVDVHMKLPGHSSANTFMMNFFLCANNPTTNNPATQNDMLQLQLYTDTTTYKILVARDVGGTDTTDLALTAVANAQGTWRLKFSKASNIVHVYFHDGAGAIVEADDEVSGSPFDLALNFSAAYAVFNLTTTEAAARMVASEGVTVTTPSFQVKYDLAAANVGLGDCKLYEVTPEDSDLTLLVPFDEGGGNKVYDLTKNLTHGSIFGASWVTGYSGKALQFNGASDYVTFPSGTGSIAAGESKTFCFWIKAPSKNKDLTSITITNGWFLRINVTTGYLFARMHDGVNLVDLTGATDVATNAWLFIAFIVDRVTQTAKFYVNAVLDGSIDISALGGLTKDHTLDIGANYSVAWYDGLFTKFRKYNKALTLAELQALYAETVTELDLESQCFAEDHVFADELLVQNGLTRILIRQNTQYGLRFFYYNSTASGYTQFLDQFTAYLVANAKTLAYPYLKKVVLNTSEKIVLDVRLEDTAAQDGDYYADLRVTLKRGCYHAEIEILEAYPVDSVRINALNASPLRFGYAGNAETKAVGDDDLDLTANNDTLSDNALIALDNDGTPILPFIASTQKPVAGNARFQASDGGDLILEDLAHVDALATKILVGYVPFSLIANLYKEAESATLAGGADTEDIAGDSGTCARLNAQNETVTWTLDPIETYLPNGRYLLLARIKDTAQVASDVGMQVYNDDDSLFLNEANAEVAKTATASFAFYQLVFDITSADAGNPVSFRVKKLTATANVIYVDYFLIVPISNGESWAQDLSHSILRRIGTSRKLFKR